jgi:hypothetical protein
MSLFVDPPFGLGQTLGVTNATDGANWVGVVKVFPDVNPTTGQVRSARVKKCIAVRNTSGVTLFGKRGVVFRPGSSTVSPESEVVGYLRDDGQLNSQLAGVADEYLSGAGVANNDIFWVTVEGPTELRLNHAANSGDHLVAVTAHTTNGTSSAGTGGFASTATVTAAGAAGIIRNVYYGRVAVTADATAAAAGVRVILRNFDGR